VSDDLHERRGRAEAQRRWGLATADGRTRPEALARFITDLTCDAAEGDQVANDALVWLLMPAVERYADNPKLYDR
jgi:hypothetical protein